MITRNHTGHRCGKDHPRAKLTTEQVRLMRDLHEKEKLGYVRLSKRFQCGESTARDICTYRTRWQA